MGLIKDLERGFFLTFPGRGNGVYISGSERCHASTSEMFSSYASLRIHKCRCCGCFFILLNNTTELTLKFDITWRIPSNPAYGKKCRSCVTDSAGLDAPLDEYRVLSSGHRRGLFKMCQ